MGPFRDGGGRAPVGPAGSLRGARAPAWKLAVEGRDARRGETMIARRGFHRAVFVAAGLYNIALGAWSIADPQWLFRLTGTTPAEQTGPFALPWVGLVG